MIKLLKIFLLTLIFAVIFLILTAIETFLHDDLEVSRVAHAGGEFNSQTYTNSIDALNYNKENYNFFELDLLLTSDNSVICLHDWDSSFRRTFNKETKTPISLEEFNLLVKNNKKYKNCTMDSLIKWLDENPSKTIITDVKDDNEKILKYIAANYSDYSNRFIPQIYEPSEYQKIRDIGYKKIIWTLYKHDFSAKYVMKHVKDMDGLYAVTMPTSRARDGLGMKLKNLGIHSFVHTINSRFRLLILRIRGIDEIYTDRI